MKPFLIPRAAHDRLNAAEARAARYAEALRAICQCTDSGPWIAVYRTAGGGYQGLQAIAREALAECGCGTPLQGCACGATRCPDCDHDAPPHRCSQSGKEA